MWSLAEKMKKCYIIEVQLVAVNTITAEETNIVNFCRVKVWRLLIMTCKTTIECKIRNKVISCAIDWTWTREKKYMCTQSYHHRGISSLPRSFVDRQICRHNTDCICWTWHVDFFLLCFATTHKSKFLHKQLFRLFIQFFGLFSAKS